MNQPNLMADRRIATMTPGDTIRLGAQEYEYIAHVPHTTRDGREIYLVMVASACATCGDRFHLRLQEAAFDARKPQNRRCEQHKARGLRVGSPRDRLVCAEVRAERAEARSVSIEGGE